jgi:hypothetical protein
MRAQCDDRTSLAARPVYGYTASKDHGSCHQHVALVVLQLCPASDGVAGSGSVPNLSRASVFVHNIYRHIKLQSAIRCSSSYNQISYEYCEHHWTS